jgi:hypothetical protein
MKTKLITCFYCFTHVLHSMGTEPAIGAKALALGCSGLMLADAFTPANNMALMTGIKTPVLGFAFANHYLLAEVKHIAICAVIPLKKISYGLQLLSYGNNTFSERSLGFSGAHSPFKAFSFGIGARYQHTSIAGYGHRADLKTDIAIHCKINQQLNFSFSVNGLFTSEIGRHTNEKQIHTYRLGLLYKVNTKAELIVEAEKNTIFRTGIKMGLQYQLNQAFYTCIGFSGAQPQYTFGIGFRKQDYQLVFASAFRQGPGLSSNITFIYEIKRS